MVTYTMRPKEETDTKIQSATFILSEKIDDTKSKKNDKDIKKEMKRLEKEKMEKEKREKKAREKEKEREKSKKDLNTDSLVTQNPSDATMTHNHAGKVVCGACGGKCSGEVLRVSDKYFHSACFTCRACQASLARGGFFYKDSGYYCPQDYQRLFGTRCAACNQYVEGEVVAALGNTYHQKCFTCARCGRAFPSGEKVTYTGTEVVCMQCAAPQRATARALSATPPAPSPLSKSESPRPNGNHRVVSENECAGCGQELSEGQALVALDRHWHTWCFACAECGTVLRGEYMARQSVAYCERDYQRLYGVKCAYCGRFIGGKVLQAGESHHFHPTCARCCKCGDAFGDGEEMFLQGSAVWHPRCGPAPNSSLSTQSALNSRSPSANGSYYSPYSSLTKCGNTSVASGPLGGRSSTLATYSYLSADGYLRRPLQPEREQDHFHRPPSASSTRASSRMSRASRPAMTALVQSINADVRAAPPIGNEEPIELSHYPSAFKPLPGTQPKIERDDFPAPPYPYTDPERRRRWSDTYKGVPISDDETDGDGTNVNGDAKLKKEEKELSKIESGIAQVFLKEVKEREKLQQWKKHNLDPRNASRTPSARREAGTRLRYSSPVGASPSRTLDRNTPVDYSSSAHPPTPYNVVWALRQTPRPGYTLSARSHTFSSTGGDFTFSGLGDKTHSTDFSSGKSDISAGSITDVDRSAVTTAEQLGVRPSHGIGTVSHGGSGGVRRSLPNMLTSALLHEPAKLYPYHLLLITNYRLPPDADRLNLERHLSDAEFEAILQIGRHDFYRLPQWRRNELKRRARLF